MLFGGFLIFLVLQSIFGWQVHNEELAEHSQQSISYWAYLGTGHFGEAVFENWESESLDQKDREGDRPRKAKSFTEMVYRNSLSIALIGFFVLSFLLHLFTGTAEYNTQQALTQGTAPISAWQFLGTPEFWFQSMQNWAVGCLVVLSIFLRQHSSPQSKPVTAPDSQTGE